MKKLLFITLIVAAMGSVFNTSGYSQASGGGGFITNGLSTPKNLITYEVNVYPSLDFLKLNATFYVVMTDREGRNVASPQVFKPGKKTYTFKEMGNVTGERGANLIPENQNTEYYLVPDFRSDNYLGGKTYVFNLYPSIKQ